MQIFVKTLAGKTLVIECMPSDLVEVIKDRVAIKEPMCVHRFYFLFAGKILEVGNTLAYHKVTKECTLHVMISAQGQRRRLLHHITHSSTRHREASVPQDHVFEFTFDATITAIDLDKAPIQVCLEEERAGVRITVAGEVASNGENTVRFTPLYPLPPSTKGYVRIHGAALTTSGVYSMSDHWIDFTTAPPPPLRLIIGQETIVLHERTFASLQQSVGAAHQISRIFTKNNPTIENDVDVQLLDDGDTIYFEMDQR